MTGDRDCCDSKQGTCRPALFPDHRQLVPNHSLASWEREDGFTERRSNWLSRSLKADCAEGRLLAVMKRLPQWPPACVRGRIRKQTAGAGNRVSTRADRLASHLQAFRIEEQRGCNDGGTGSLESRQAPPRWFNGVPAPTPRGHSGPHPNRRGLTQAAWRRRRARTQRTPSPIRPHEAGSGTAARGVSETLSRNM